MDREPYMTGVIRIEVAVPAGQSAEGRVAPSFLEQMAVQLTPLIEEKMMVSGIGAGDLLLSLAFAPNTFFEHTADHVTYRRLLFSEGGRAAKDFWVKWERLDGGRAFSVLDEVDSQGILFSLGEDVSQKIREKEFRYLVSADSSQYRAAMGRKSVTEWREIVKRAVKRGVLQKVSVEERVEESDKQIRDRLAALGITAPAAEPAAAVGPSEADPIRTYAASLLETAAPAAESVESAEAACDPATEQSEIFEQICAPASECEAVEQICACVTEPTEPAEPVCVPAAARTEQVSAASEEPTAASEEPTAASEEPTTTSEELTTALEEPTTTSEEPPRSEVPFAQTTEQQDSLGSDDLQEQTLAGIRRRVEKQLRDEYEKRERELSKREAELEARAQAMAQEQSSLATAEADRDAELRRTIRNEMRLEAEQRERERLAAEAQMHLQKEVQEAEQREKQRLADEARRESEDQMRRRMENALAAEGEARRLLEEQSAALILAEENYRKEHTDHEQTKAHLEAERAVRTDLEQRLEHLQAEREELSARLRTESAARAEAEAKMQTANMAMEEAVARYQTEAQARAILQQQLGARAAEDEKRLAEQRRLAEQQAARAAEERRQAEQQAARAAEERRRLEQSRSVPAPDPATTYIQYTARLFFHTRPEEDIIDKLRGVLNEGLEQSGENVYIEVSAARENDGSVTLTFRKFPEGRQELLTHLLRYIGNSGIGISRILVD